MDIVDQLTLDPGRLTLGELLQQREAARHEIVALRQRLITQAQRGPGMHTSELAAATVKDRLPLQPGILVNAKTVASALGIGRSTLYKMIADGRFPVQSRLGPRTARWRSDDVLEWLRHTYP